jgi:hypothetical protein
MERIDTSGIFVKDLGIRSYQEVWDLQKDFQKNVLKKG